MSYNISYQSEDAKQLVAMIIVATSVLVYN